MPVEFIVPLVALVAVVGACLFATMQVKSIYNQLVVLKNLTSNSFSQISVQLKRRHDLIPNLVQCVKMYMGHENETLTAVIAARNTAASNLQNAKKNPTDTAALAKLAQSESSLGGALGRLSMVMEAYPELKADAATAKLTEELTSTENRIAFARQAFNDLATDFNIFRQTFPTNLFASMIGFKEDYSMLEFENAEAIQEAPQIELV